MRSLLTLLTPLGMLLASVSVALAAEQPNIIFMLSDDQAWNGLSVPMHPQVPASRSSSIDTPHLARLSAEGMRFSADYAPAPVC